MGRLDLRPERCPPLEYPRFQDPGFTVISGLFLGLFGVTPYSCVAVGSVYPGYGTVWHCFDTVLALFGPGITLDAVSPRS